MKKIKTMKINMCAQRRKGDGLLRAKKPWAVFAAWLKFRHNGIRMPNTVRSFSSWQLLNMSAISSHNYTFIVCFHLTVTQYNQS